MPAFHLLRCSIDLGNDHSTTVVRDRTRPIVFPELPILQYLHGEDAVTDVHVVGQWETTNDEVLQRIQTLYDAEIIKQVFPGTRPRLPTSDASVPLCTMPVYKPRTVRPANPDPRLRPLDQFTMSDDAVEAPPLPAEDDPTPDEIVAHVQDDKDEDLGLVPPNPGDQPHIVRDTRGRGASQKRTPNTLPDVNAGGSHPAG